MTFTSQDLVEMLSQLSMQHPLAGSAIAVVLLIIVILRPLALEFARACTCRTMLTSCPPGTLLARTCGRDRMLVVAAPLAAPHTVVSAYLSRRQAAS